MGYGVYPICPIFSIFFFFSESNIFRLTYLQKSAHLIYDRYIPKWFYRLCPEKKSKKLKIRKCTIIQGGSLPMTPNVSVFSIFRPLKGVEQLLLSFYGFRFF